MEYELSNHEWRRGALDQYAVNRAFHAYQDAVAEWSRASVELDKAHARMEAAASVLRTFMENK